jgi:hypothetical protein
MCHTPDPRPLDALEEKLRAGCALRWRLPPPAVLVRDLQVPHAMALDPPRAGHAAGSWATSSSAGHPGAQMPSLPIPSGRMPRWARWRACSVTDRIGAVCESP